MAIERRDQVAHEKRISMLCAQSEKVYVERLEKERVERERGIWREKTKRRMEKKRGEAVDSFTALSGTLFTLFGVTGASLRQRCNRRGRLKGNVTRTGIL